MKKGCSYINMCIFACDIVCILLSFLFFYQIMEQKDVLLEAKMIAAVESLVEENNVLSEREKEITYDIQEFLLRSEELEEEICGAESRYEEVEKNYRIRQYIDSAAMQIDKDYGSSVYIDRYFQIKKEEVYDVINSHDIEERLISVRESGMEIFIGEGMWLRYGLGLEDNLPLGLIIRNPNVNIGYKNARAGMLLRDLEKEFPAVEDKFIHLGYAGIYYLQYEDDSYMYYYIGIDDIDYPTVLYIEPKL